MRLDNRMASTIRHNRARGSHDVDLMSNIVKELHELGRSDAWISKHLGMDRDEILRLKQITGLAALFKDVKFGQAWRPVEDEYYEEERRRLRRGQRRGKGACPNVGFIAVFSDFLYRAAVKARQIQCRYHGGFIKYLRSSVINFLGI